MKKIIALIISISVAGYCFAAKQYKVELIVFSKVDQASLQSEHWKQQLLKPNMPDWVDLSKPAANNTSIDYKLLKTKSANWKWILRRMKKSDYKILSTASWIQPGDSQGKWIHIYGGQAYNAQGEAIDTPESDAIDSSNPAFWELNGALKVSIDRYIFVSSKLYLTLPVSDVFNISDEDFGKQYGLVPLQTFLLFETQRDYLDQYLYFDHPLFGALVYVSPYAGNAS